MRAHYRCRECDTRHVFEHDPDSYRRRKKCRHCGAQNFRRDKWMNTRNTSMHNGGMGCMCGGYPEMSARNAPHRKGSLWCWYRKDGTQRMPGDPDFRDAEYEAWQAQENLMNERAA